MIRILALHGPPVDPSTYDSHYIDVHMPIVLRIPGVRKIRHGRVIGAPNGEPLPYFLVSDVYFDDEAALEKALASPEMAEAFADAPNFATGGLTIMFCEAHDIDPAETG
jgi:uncharacterized protein (TIGR02118 family)